MPRPGSSIILSNVESFHVVLELEVWGVNHQSDYATFEALSR